MHFRRLFAVSSFLFVAGSALAAPQTSSYPAYIAEVHAPNVLRLVPENGDEHFYFEMADIDYGEVKNVPCTNKYLNEWQHAVKPASKTISKKAKAHCKKLVKRLKHENVHFEVTDWGKPILKGYLRLNNHIVNLQLIQEGMYRADPQQTRSAAPYLLERQARCDFRGIWKDLAIHPAEQLKCNL